jgi:hypothetical protein
MASSSSSRQEQTQTTILVGTELDTGRVSAGVPQSEGKRACDRIAAVK